MNDKKFIIELNEKQLQLLKIALEEYFRIRMNQWRDLADDLASRCYDLSPKNSNNEVLFHTFIEKRNCVESMLEAVGRLTIKYGFLAKSKEQLIAEDMWQVFRYTLWNENHKPGEDDWCVDSRPPMQWSNEPLPVCRRVGE